MSDEEQKQIFAINLNHYLELNGKTQKEVANAIGVSPQTFNTWIQGIALPRMGKVQKLADYFGIGKSDLIDIKSKSDKDQLENGELKYLIEIAQDCNENSMHRLLEYAKRLLDLQKMDEENRNND